MTMRWTSKLGTWGVIAIIHGNDWRSSYYTWYWGKGELLNASTGFLFVRAWLNEGRYPCRDEYPEGSVILFATKRGNSVWWEANVNPALIGME